MESSNHTQTTGRPQALTDFWDLVAEIDRNSADLGERLERAIQACAGTKLDSVDELKAFKAAFDRVTRCTRLTPVLTDGSHGTLQIRSSDRKKACTAASIKLVMELHAYKTVLDRNIKSSAHDAARWEQPTWICARLTDRATNMGAGL